MQRDQVVARIRAFVNENFLYMRPDFELADDDSLMGTGVVDSMGVMEMIEFIESEFGVTVGDADITEENLGSIDAIASYVIARGAGERQTA